MTSANDRRVVALLRAVNVGGRVLKMADLKAIAERLGCVDPRTLLTSGNIVFGLPKGRLSPAQIEAAIEAELQRRLSLASDVFIRSASQWEQLIADNPFPDAARTDPARLIAVVLRESPAASAVKALQAGINGPETLRARDRQLYIIYPDGMGRSKLTGSVIERTLGTRGTARNWNTVLKLSALVQPTHTDA